MKILFNRSICVGHAKCHERGPDVYPLDDNGYCKLPSQRPVDVPAGLEEQARAGAANCPEAAITLIEDGPATVGNG